MADVKSDLDKMVLRANEVFEAVIDAMNSDNVDMFDYYLDRYSEIVGELRKFATIKDPVIAVEGIRLH